MARHVCGMCLSVRHALPMLPEGHVELPSVLR